MAIEAFRTYHQVLIPVAVYVPGAGGVDCEYLCRVCHLSWCWFGPYWTEVHVTGFHSTGQRHTPSWHCSPLAAQACRPPPLGLCSGPAWMNPYCKKAKDPFVSSSIAWHDWEECHILMGLLDIPPCHHLGKGVHLCLHEHLHMEVCYHRTGVMWPPHQLNDWFQEADIFWSNMQICLLDIVVHNRRKRISGVMLTSGQQHPNTWGRHRQSCLSVFAPAIGWHAQGKYLDEGSSLKDLSHFNFFFMLWK